PAPRSGGPGKPVAIILIVIGGLLLIGTVAGVIRSVVADASRIDDTLTVDAAGITSLDVDAAASSFRLEFGDVDEATLEITDARSEWTLTRDGDELQVGTPDELFGDWGPRFGRNEEQVVLTLPESLRDAEIDADLTLAAGELRAEGAFGELDLELGAGGMNVSGSARTLTADISAGDARVELADVSEAEITVSAGRLVGELTGSAPDLVTAGVSAGSLDLTLPAGSYDVNSDASAGRVDNRLDTDDSSAHRVTVDLSAGHATLRSDD
ncbi:AsmA family protein, partial [Microbacterium paludicola]|uniref:hypothetical protein n=1 Tax=Microbacterium paludicola TaxID=300019 RepID=UPI00142FD8E6